MADFKYTPVAPGEAVTADKLDAAFTSAEDTLNALPTYSVADTGLGHQQLPPLISEVKSRRLLAETSYDLVVNVSGAEKYRGRYARGAGLGGKQEYAWDNDPGDGIAGGTQDVAQNDGSATDQNGSAFTGDTGWYVIGVGGGAGGTGNTNRLEIQLGTQPAFGGADTPIKAKINGVLVMLDIDFIRMYMTGPDTATASSDVTNSVIRFLGYFNNYVVFAIQVRLRGAAGVSTWYTLPKTVRVVDIWRDWYSRGGVGFDVSSGGTNYYGPLQDMEHFHGGMNNSTNERAYARDHVPVSIRTLITKNTLTNAVTAGGLELAHSNYDMVEVRGVVAMRPDSGDPDEALLDAGSDDLAKKPVIRLELGAGQISTLVLLSGIAEGAG